MSDKRRLGWLIRLERPVALRGGARRRGAVAEGQADKTMARQVVRRVSGPVGGGVAPRSTERFGGVPGALEDARSAFSAATTDKTPALVDDPQYARTESRRLKERADLKRVVVAQREGEALSGTLPRK